VETNFSVSVCMITYNQQACIKQAMESVLAQQTDFAMELNIFNDASTDNTDEVIREVISSHPGGNRVNYYLHEKISGYRPITFTL
jgi:glycosyltransferase involved in cell wall biosynthesis